MSSTTSTSFDAIVAEKPATAEAAATDTTNSQGSEALMAGLLAAAKNAGTAQPKQQEAPDLSALFPSAAPAEAAPTTASATATTETGTGTGTGTETKPAATTPAANAFLTQINDDKIVDALVQGIKPQPFQLAPELTAAFEENEELVLNQANLTAIMAQAAAEGQRQSLNQTIGLIRELIPALTQEAQAAAVKDVTQTQNTAQALAGLADNPALQSLVKSLLNGKEVSDPQAVIKQARAMMASINADQMKLQTKDAPADRSMETFLDTVQP